MRTLHLYLARDLLKTFALTCVALTLLVVLGGGVANIFKGEGIAATDVFKVFIFLTPVAVTLILPVAALFSAAITYGRTAADNEITACRAAGINVHRLLLSAGVLGLAVTLVTLWTWNYTIPQLSKRIEDITRLDLHSIVVQQFSRAKPLVFGRYRLTATRCEVLDPSAIPEHRPGTHFYLLLTGVSFIEMEDEEIMRYGTADATIIDFEQTQGTPLIAVDLQNVRFFDSARGQYYDLAHQSLPPLEIPLPIRRKTKFEDLGNLLLFLERPEESFEVGNRLEAMRRELMTHAMYLSVVRHLRAEGYFRLHGADVEYEIHSQEGSQDPDDGRPVMRRIRVIEKGKAGEFQYTADSATIELRSTLERNRPVIVVELIGNVEIRRVGVAGDARPVHKPKETLKPIQFMDQPELNAAAKKLDARSILSGEHVIGLHAKQTKQYERLIEYLEKYRGEVRGEIHFRCSYAISTIAVVVMGAALGIIVRGGQVLTAFGISCIPSMFVVLSSIVGRNLADRPQYSMLSLGVMWGGAILMYVATIVIMAKFLKR